MKTISIATFLFFSTICFAQPAKKELTVNEKKIISCLYLYKECSGFNGYSIVVSGAERFGTNGELLSQEFYNKSLELDYGPFNLEIIYEAHFVWENGTLKGITFSNNQCQENADDVQVNSGAIWSIHRISTNYYFDWDNNGKLTVINVGDYEKYNGGPWRRSYYTIEYFSSGKLKKISSMISIAKGKKMSDLKEEYNYPIAERNYFDNEENKVSIVRYTEKKDKKDESRIIKDEIISLKKENGKEIIESYDNLKKTKNNKRTSELNEKGQIIKSTVTGPDDKIIRIIEAEYNNLGWMIKMGEKTFTPDGKFSEHTERYCTFKLKENGDPNDRCAYTRKFNSKGYNEKGELVLEIEEGRSRKKDENGNWGPWKGDTY